MNISYLDIFIVVVMVIALVKGYMKGFVVEVLSIIAFFAGLYAAIELSIPVATNFFRDSEYFQLLTVAVFVGLFVAVVLLISLLAKILKKAIDFTFLGFFDNLLGALAGLFKAAFVLSVLIWVFSSIGFRLSPDVTDQSLIYGYLEFLGPTTYTWLSRLAPFIKEMIENLENFGSEPDAVFTFLYF